MDRHFKINLILSTSRLGLMALLFVGAALWVPAQARGQSDPNPLRLDTLPVYSTPSPARRDASVHNDPAVRQTGHADSEQVQAFIRGSFDRQLDNALESAGNAPYTAVPAFGSNNSNRGSLATPLNSNSGERPIAPQPLNFGGATTQDTFKPLPGSSVQPAKPAAEKPVQLLPSLELSETLKKIILNTILVLVVAVTFIYIATKTRRNGVIPGGKPRPTIGIEQTLALGNKAVLKIVRIGEQQVLIAMDASGVKSVISLPEPFLAGLEASEIAEAPKLKQPEPVLNATEQLLAKQLEQFDPEFKKWLLMHQTFKTAS